MIAGLISYVKDNHDRAVDLLNDLENLKHKLNSLATPEMMNNYLRSYIKELGE